MRAPSPLDSAVLEVVREELAKHGDVAILEQQWVDAAEMWFVQVAPVNGRAVPLEVGVDGDDLSVTVGRTCFEMFPVSESSLDNFRQIVRAILAGRIEEAGPKREGAGTARIFTDNGPVTVGVLFPWPWRLRPHRRYQGYGAGWGGQP